MENSKKARTSVKKGAINHPRVGIVDKETGEVLDEGQLIYVPKRLRIKGFFMAMQDGLEYVAKAKLKGEALNVLMLLMSRMDFENAIVMSQKEIGDILTMKAPNVSRAIKALKEAGIVDAAKAAAHPLRLSSDIGWKGRVSSLREQQRKTEEARNQVN